MNSTHTTSATLPKNRRCFEAFVTSVPLFGFPGVRTSSLWTWTWRRSNEPEIRTCAKSLWMLHWTQGLHKRGLFWKGFRHSYVYKSNFSEHYVRWAVVSILVLILFFHYNCYPYPFFLLVILNVIIFCFLWEYFNSTKSCHFSSFIYSRKKPRLIKNENCLSVLFFMRAL